ncbi:MAG TPA: hypothetical protein DGO89_00960 [Microcoleaceae bacterium UBA9251]|nr:hypothetical protein [Microcoleaceae cyanobacterium UBA9251]
MAVTPKKNPAKIGRELINQGASTNLVSGIYTPLSGMFGFLAKFLVVAAIRKKKPGQNWSGVNQSGCIY